MTEEKFEQVIEETLNELRNILIEKGKEYRRFQNPFHNFEQGAKRTGKLREEVLDGFMLKHEISIADMTNDLAIQGKLPSKETVGEKFNDNLIYLLIKKAMFTDRIERE